MRLMMRFLGFLFALGAIVFVVGAVGATYVIFHYNKDLPDYSALQDYEPPVMTRVHASDGALVAEYAKERRLYIPIQAVPKLVKDAFISAEDKNFYEHGGIDPTGVIRAVWSNIENYGKRRAQGASTITQQVAKNFLVGDERSIHRKIKEALLAVRIERAYSKDKILELYLNEIYLGLGAYGIAAASLIYFDKSVHELTLEEAAYLAALPKAPTTLHPFRQRERAIERRNYVIDRMVENGVASAAEGQRAKKADLNVTPRPTGARIFAAEYFAEEVRREVYERYGEKKLYEGGLSVRTSLNPKLQLIAKKALSDGLVRYDENKGWRGAPATIEVAGDWGAKLADQRALTDIPWKLAVVLESDNNGAKIGLQPPRERSGQVSKERETGIIPLDGLKWAKWIEGSEKGKPITRANQVLKPGDVIYVDALTGKDGGVIRGAVAFASGPGSRRRHHGNGSVDRARARDGRRLFVRREPIQSREPSPTPAGLVVQTVCICDGARQRLHAFVGGARWADRDQPGPRHAGMEAGKLFSPILRAANSTVRHRTIS